MEKNKDNTPRDINIAEGTGNVAAMYSQSGGVFEYASETNMPHSEGYMEELKAKGKLKEKLMVKGKKKLLFLDLED